MDYCIEVEKCVSLISQYNKINKCIIFPNIDKGELAVLSIITCNKEICSNDVAKKLEISRPRLSSIVKSLIRKKYIVLSFKKEDKRKKILLATPEGIDVIKKTKKMLEDKLSALFTKLGKEKTKIALELIEEIIEYYSENEKKEKEYA